MDSFGVLFGRLVREKRGVEGLSQDGLAAESGLTKARISELERGRIANPQVRTIDALCVALNIQPDERASCHPASTFELPPSLLQKLARQFGRDMPNATEEELEAFLMAKAEEFRSMQGRLTTLAESEGRISELIKAANVALGVGEFSTADGLLMEAEEVHLQSTTIVALRSQARLRIERANASLVIGDIESAVTHFEKSSSYFSGIGNEFEAENRHECVMLLRYYGYRYRNATALFAARNMLNQNFAIWTKDVHTEKWCQTKNALGGVEVRLSQFDIPKNAILHLMEAKGHYEEVRAVCSDTFLPKIFATTCLDLANVFSERRLAKTDEEYEKNLRLALKSQMTALRFFSKYDDPREWGVLQHNLGLTYTWLSNIRPDETKSAAYLKSAIDHLEQSFEVRNPEDSLQYWVASCRSLGEALINMSKHPSAQDAADILQRAFGVLNDALAKISSAEHPLQWTQIQTQLARCI